MDTPADIEPRSRDSYRAWTAIPIRFGDQDALGHVNNVAIASYFEHARCTHLVPHLRAEASHLSTVLARITIDYVQEMTFPGTVDVGIRITRQGTKSFVIAGGIFRGTSCCATSAATMVFVDSVARTSAVPTATLLARLQFMR